MQVVTKEQIIEELKSIGLKENDVVMVHTSLKKDGIRLWWSTDRYQVNEPTGTCGFFGSVDGEKPEIKYIERSGFYTKEK